MAYKNSVYNNQIGINWNDNVLVGGVSYKSDLTNGDIELGACLCNSIKFRVREPIANVMTHKNDCVFWSHKFIGSPFEKVMGKYIITEIKEINKNTTEVVAYDGMIAFDKIIDEWLNGLTFPMTLSAFTDSLITYCAHPDFGATYIHYGANENFMVQDNFKAIGITGRQVLQYIAQLCGGMCFYNLNGRYCYLYIQPFGFNTLPTGDFQDMAVYTPDNYKSIEISDEAILPIDKLIVKVNDDDVGVSAGTGENIIFIENNPLLYTQSVDEIQPAVNNIFNQIKNVSYYTGKVNAFNFTNSYPSSFRSDVCGCYIKVNDKPMLITSVKIDDTGVKLQSSGSYKRNNQGSPINSQIIALRGKTNQLTIDIEHTNSTLTDKMNGLESSVNQTAEKLTTEITKANETASKAEQTANGFSQEITNVKGDVSSLTQTVNGFDTRITDAEGNATTAIQTATGLTLKTKMGKDGKSASITLGNPDGTAQSKADIKFDGLVSFENLSTPGETTIDGGNITTGQISADYIDASTLEVDAANVYGTLDATLVGLQGYLVVYNSRKTSGYIGDAGSSTAVDSDGVIMAGPGWDGYFVATKTGARMTYEESRTSKHSIYVGQANNYGSGCYASEDIQVVSDRNEKHDINYDIAETEKFFNTLKPCSFILNNDSSNRVRYGFIAQDVEEGLKTIGKDESNAAIISGFEDKKSISYTQFIPLNTYMIQAQQKKINDLEARVAELEKLIKK